MIDKHVGDMLILIGANDPAINFLQDETTETASASAVFKGSIWALSPDGTFLFQPSLLASMRNNLNPIKGYYTLIGDRVEFQGKQQSVQGIKSSLNGTINLQVDTILLDVDYTAAEATHHTTHLTQKLCLQPYIFEKADSWERI
jgi:hypothetical protein